MNSELLGQNDIVWGVGLGVFLFLGGIHFKWVPTQVDLGLNVCYVCLKQWFT